MREHTGAPRAGRLAPGSAGRNKRPSNRLSPEDYHGGDGGTRPELFRVLTPQGVVIAGAFIWREGEEVFEKDADATKHMLTKPCEAWAIATQAVEEALRRGVERVAIRDRRHGLWWARVPDFEEHGVPIDRGWGPQVALALQWWSFVPLRSVTVKQLGLFAEVAG